MALTVTINNAETVEDGLDGLWIPLGFYTFHVYYCFKNAGRFITVIQYLI